MEIAALSNRIGERKDDLAAEMEMKMDEEGQRWKAMKRKTVE